MFGIKFDKRSLLGSFLIIIGTILLMYYLVVYDYRHIVASGGGGNNKLWRANAEYCRSAGIGSMILHIGNDGNGQLVIVAADNKTINFDNKFKWCWKKHRKVIGAQLRKEPMKIRWTQSYVGECSGANGMPETFDISTIECGPLVLSANGVIYGVFDPIITGGI
jgi:hypothetical protein